MQEHPLSPTRPNVPKVRTADTERRVDNDVLNGKANHALHRRRERLEVHIRAHLLLRSRVMLMRNPQEGLLTVRAGIAQREGGHHCEDNLRNHGC